MNSLGTLSTVNGTDVARRFAEFERELAELKSRVSEAGQLDRLSLIVFSGSLDRLIAAFVLATGAASSGMEVNVFFTFWGTSALRRDNVSEKKGFIEKMFGWMLPKGSRKLPLSQMNFGGGGPVMMRYLMKKKGVASVEEMMALAAELGVKVYVCTMSMDLLGIKESEIMEYPDLQFCGVAKFLDTASPGKVTMFL
jgi:peroxiredoxin family protein